MIFLIGIKRQKHRSKHGLRRNDDSKFTQKFQQVWYTTVQLFDNTSLRERLDASRPEARMVFNLLHTFSHLCVRQAALLCGLDSTRLSEYLLPRALTFALYCNHRFGATIGALTALFEPSLADWLNA